MISWAPPGENPALETREAGLIRYQEVQEDLGAVVFDPNTRPAFGGKNGRIKTFFLALSIAAKESGFAKNVDYGFGDLAFGDDGDSFCLMQNRLGPFKTTEGWYGKDLVGSREARRRCFIVGIRNIINSFALCRYYSGSDRLGGYTSGKCFKGNYAARVRYNRAIEYVSNNKIENDDQVSLTK